jgi:hypothetical protein
LSSWTKPRAVATLFRAKARHGGINAGKGTSLAPGSTRASELDVERSRDDATSGIGN